MKTTQHARLHELLEREKMERDAKPLTAAPPRKRSAGRYNRAIGDSSCIRSYTPPEGEGRGE